MQGFKLNLDEQTKEIQKLENSDGIKLFTGVSELANIGQWLKVDRPQSMDGGGWFSEQKVIINKVTGNPAKNGAIDNNFGLMSSNIINNWGVKYSKQNTTQEVPVYKQIAPSTLEGGQELLKLMSYGVDKDWATNGIKVRLNNQDVVIGMQGGYEPSDANKGLPFKDIENLNSRQLDDILKNSIPTMGGIKSHEYMKTTEGKALNKTYLFNPTGATAGGGNKKDTQSFYGGENSSIKFAEHEFVEKATELYHQRRLIEERSKKLDEQREVNKSNLKTFLNDDTPRRDDFGNQDFLKLTDEQLSKPFENFSTDKVLEAIATAESNGDTNAVGTNKNGTKDYGKYQINENWFRVDTPFDKNDSTFKEAESIARQYHPDWDNMDNKKREEAFLGDANEEFTKEFSKKIYEGGGIGVWSTGKQGGKVVNILNGVEVEPKKTETRKPKVAPKTKNPFNKELKELDLDKSPNAKVTMNQVERQAKEVLKIDEQLKTLELLDPENFDRAVKLTELKNINLADDGLYKDFDIDGNAVEVGNKSIMHQNLEDATTIEHDQAKNIYELAKDMNMDLPWNLFGSEADAGYKIYREYQKGNEEYKTPAMDDAILDLVDMMENTNKQIAPMVEFAKSRGGRQSQFDFVDRGQGGGRDAEVRGGTVFDFGSTTQGVKQDALFEKNQPFLNNRERLNVDIKNLAEVLRTKDPLDDRGRNVQQELAGLLKRKEREINQLGNMTMSQTKDAALAVLDAFRDNQDLFANNE